MASPRIPNAPVQYLRTQMQQVLSVIQLGLDDINRDFRALRTQQQDVRVLEGTAYTLLDQDAGAYLRYEGSDPITVTVPADTDTNLQVGATIRIRQSSSGQITVAGAAGVTIATSTNLVTSAQGHMIWMVKVGASLWDATFLN